MFELLFTAQRETIFTILLNKWIIHQGPLDQYVIIVAFPSPFMHQYLYNVGKQFVDISDNGIWGNMSVSITGCLMREDLY